MAKSGTQHHWKVLDATSQDSEGFDGYGITESAALKSALDKFGEKAQYGRGTIGVRIPATMPSRRTRRASSGSSASRPAGRSPAAASTTWS